jgi:uncharacterized protein (TIGR03083 family)
MADTDVEQQSGDGGGEDESEQALAALGASVDRLRQLAGGLTPEQARRPAYPSEWTIAQVLSHIGSGAVIMRRRVADTVAGEDYDDAFNTATWDVWNAKDPDAQVADAVDADRALLDALAAVGPAERATFHVAFGPLDLDFAGFVRLRLNEHVLHTWDVAVALDPAARLPADGTAWVLDAGELIAGFTGQPADEAHTLWVRTTDPDRDLTLALGPEGVVLSPGIPDGAAGDGGGGEGPDVELPAEAFVRLVYGRLDADHTPPGTSEAHLDELRRTFPGL